MVPSHPVAGTLRFPANLRLSYPIGMRIAELLRGWRHHEEMSVREAAERVGIPPSTYQRVEKGYPMSGETLAVVLRWLLEI
jgi:DNA-binding XRE family transcriptional regulator